MVLEMPYLNNEYVTYITTTVGTTQVVARGTAAYHHSASPTALWNTESLPWRLAMPLTKLSFHLLRVLFTWTHGHTHTHQ